MLVNSAAPAPGDGGFEARCLRNDEICGDAAVGLATDTELVRVRDALSNGVIDDGHVVLIVLVAPIREDGLAEVLAVARGASGIWIKDHVTVGGEELREILKLRLVRLTRVRRAAGAIAGYFFPGHIIYRLVHVTVDCRAILGLEGNIFAWGELELWQARRRSGERAG